MPDKTISDTTTSNRRGEFVKQGDQVVFKESLNGKFTLISIDKTLQENLQPCLFFVLRPEYSQKQEYTDQ